MEWGIVPAGALMLLFTAIMPVFCFALYRDEGSLRIPKRLRLLALAAALTFSVIILTALPGLVRSLAGYLAVLAAFNWRLGANSVLIILRDPRAIGQISTVLGEISAIAFILLLVAIFQQPSDGFETDVPVSRLLNRVTKAAVISWGLWVAFLAVRVIAMPFVFLQLRTYALQVGRTPPQLKDMMAEATYTLLVQACLFAAPYIVYRSLRERFEGRVDAQSGPELIEGGD
jgi:hypothetical protein